MNREDIIRMARQAGSLIEAVQEKDLQWLERFATLVASAEREACAKVCEEQMQGKSIWIEGARACSLAIRARGQA
jgi:hypothetical protein